MPHSEKLKGMIKQGIPHSVRPQIWLRISGALETRNKSDTSYKEIVKASSNDNLMTSKQIEKVRVKVQLCYNLRPILLIPTFMLHQCSMTYASM